MEGRLLNFICAEIGKTVDVMNALLASETLLEVVQAAGDACANAVAGGGKVMFCGNGGSAADCQHLAAELVGRLAVDRPAMAGMALTVDTSVLTAVGNDSGYEFVFSRQVEGLGRTGDVLVGISTSGRSQNVVRG